MVTSSRLLSGLATPPRAVALRLFESKGFEPPRLVIVLVGKERLELSRPCGHTALNRTCLPIPPHPHVILVAVLLYAFSFQIPILYRPESVGLAVNRGKLNPFQFVRDYIGNISDGVNPGWHIVT